MGSIAAMSKREMSPARARLLAAAKAARYGLKELSQMLDRNPSYLQQYVVKASPRALPEDIRHRLAAILHIDEGQLRDEAEVPAAGAPPLPIAAAAAAAAVSARPQAATTGRLRLVSEDDTSTEAIAATTAFLAPADLAAEGNLAIRLMRPHGLLQPRHIVVCDTTSPPRLGDLAYVAAPGTEPAIGLLLPAAHGNIGVLEGTEERHLPAEGARVLRIVAVRTA